MSTLELLQHTDTVNELLARYGVKFGIYKNNTFKEQLFPFDAIPRIIDCYEGEIIEELRAPADGIVFFMHGEPLTYSQTAVFKLILHEE